MNYLYEMPEELLAECEHKGRVERFEYDTTALQKYPFWSGFGG